MDAKNDQMANAETSDEYCYLVTQGFWQYYDRLMYADLIQGRNGGIVAGVAKYDAAGINHKVFDGGPVVWDPSVTVPYGATASTECGYGIHKDHFTISLRQEEAFHVTEWEKPREHDQYRSLVSQIRTRYTPFVSAMRPHFVMYNLPANPD